eukprot:CAMPEP_0201491308 /NCGR_PEP_ID=MMETSP0151_2-20130828/29327_1 /ASSEMBLY_ACC=CAM_ASM_000257 /TAXON_ID=200890 /ORGANISM="Paramoeba atlantica, Strain 621/1 / CCAP 1560/9" /LENGTH=88 /DNA_ID=CAMNT_0047877603 /DNA_START=37 /DNA_END=300 /DNA_ORIENTATION=-
MDDKFATRPSKVSPLLLSQEDMLERLIVHLTGRHKTWIGTHSKLFGRSKPASVCKWKGVTCDSHTRVTEIMWESMSLEGRLQWDSLPK